MKILITGGLGFIGSHLAEYLIKKNHQVVIFTKSLKKHKNIKLIENSIKIEKVDISNFTLVPMLCFEPLFGAFILLKLFIRGLDLFDDFSLPESQERKESTEKIEMKKASRTEIISNH